MLSARKRDRNLDQPTLNRGVSKQPNFNEDGENFK
jgi:hypothetical protein